MARFALAAFFLALSFGARAGTLDVDFEGLERALRLKPAQQEQYDRAVAATQRALLAVAAAGLQIKERVARELEKPLPDLEALYDIHEQVIERNKPLFRAARDEWSRLYAQLDREQLAIARRYVEEKLNVLAPK